MKFNFKERKACLVSFGYGFLTAIAILSAGFIFVINWMFCIPCLILCLLAKYLHNMLPLKIEACKEMKGSPQFNSIYDICRMSRQGILFMAYIEKLRWKHSQEQFEMATKLAARTPRDIEWWLEVKTPNYLQKQYEECISNEKCRAATEMEVEKHGHTSLQAQRYAWETCAFEDCARFVERTLKDISKRNDQERSSK